MEPCTDEQGRGVLRAGVVVGNFCPTCDHLLFVHRRDSVCELCAIREWAKSPAP